MQHELSLRDKGQVWDILSDLQATSAKGKRLFSGLGLGLLQNLKGPGASCPSGLLLASATSQASCCNARTVFELLPSVMHPPWGPSLSDLLQSSPSNEGCADTLPSSR